MLEPVFSHYSHDDLVTDIHSLAAAVDGGSWRPDFIVGIGRGGLVPGAYLSHRMDIALLSVDHSSPLTQLTGERLMTLAGRSAAGDRILFVDDINDSGSTIRALRESVAGFGGAMDNVRFAVLIDNASSASSVDYGARAIDRRTDKRWFVFPWEQMARRETLVAEAREVPERLA